MTRTAPNLKPAPARPTERRGVILLEIVLALALFVLTAAVVGSALARSLDAMRLAKTEAQAMNVAASVLADLQVGRIAEPAETPPTPYRLNETDEDTKTPWTYELAVEELDGAPGLKRVTVTVAHADGILRRPVQLTAWLAAIGDDSEEALP